MPKTPKQSLETNDLNRSNPWIQTRINKSLLSRCRNVGLSRHWKSKTSNKPLEATSVLNVKVTTPTTDRKTTNELEVEARHSSKRLLLENEGTTLKIHEKDGDKDNLFVSSLINEKNCTNVNMKKSPKKENDEDILNIKEKHESKEKERGSPLNTLNLHIATGINKSLLSRCPRVGLSRKRKSTAPNQYLSTITSANSETKIFDINEQPIIKKSNVSKGLLQENKDSTSKIHKKIKNIEKNIITHLKATESDDDHSNLASIMNNKQESGDADVKEFKTTEVLKKDTKCIIDKDEYVTKQDKSADVKQKTSLGKYYQTDKTNRNEKVIKALPNKENKKRKLLLSQEENNVGNPIKTLSESVLPALIQKSPLKLKIETKINTIIDSPELEVLKSCDKPLKVYKKSTKIRRSLSLKKSLSGRNDDEEFDDLLLQDCFVSLTPPAALTTNEIDVDTLEKQVMEKHKILDELKQAEIYKKKYEVSQLEELTEKYKQGCIAALRDLQKHGNVETATLLTNLGVPKDLISLADID